MAAAPERYIGRSCLSAQMMIVLLLIGAYLFFFLAASCSIESGSFPPER